MSIPFWGSLLFSDSDELAIYGPTDTGSPSIGDTTHSTSDRKSVLVFSPSDDTDTYKLYTIKQRRHGSQTDRDNAERVMVRIRMRVTEPVNSIGSGFVALWQSFPKTGSLGCQCGLTQSGGIYYLTIRGNDSTNHTSATPFTFGEWGDLFIYADQISGSVRMAYRELGAGSITELVNESQACNTINRSRLGLVFVSVTSQTYNIRYEVDQASWKHYWSGETVSAWDDVDVDVEDFVASGCRDVSQTESSIAYVYTTGRFRNDTHARVTYGTDSVLSGSSSTDWVETSTFDSHNHKRFLLDSLSADTVYYYRFELSGDGSTVDHTSSIRKFRTLPNVGVESTIWDHVWSCQCTESFTGPCDVMEEMVDWCDSEGLTIHRSHLIGDLFYESAADGELETAAQYRSIVKQGFYSVFTARLNRECCLRLKRDDHEVINDGDSRLKAGGSLENTLANDWGQKQIAYNAETTIGELYANSTEVWQSYVMDHYLFSKSGRSSGGAIEHGHMKAGKYYYVFLDTRWEGRDRTTVAVGSTQMAWLKERIDDFASDTSTHTMFIVGTCLMNEPNAFTSDDWWVWGSTEVKEIVDYINDTLTSTGKGVVYAGGDRHVMYAAHKCFQGAAGYLDNIAFRMEFTSSGSDSELVANQNDTLTNSMYHDNVWPRMLARYDWDNRGGEPGVSNFGTAGDGVFSHRDSYSFPGGGTLFSGVLVEWDGARRTTSHRYWTDGVGRNGGEPFTHPGTTKLLTSGYSPWSAHESSCSELG